MTEVVWPPPNPAADALLAAYLDRVAPRWSRQPMRMLSGEQLAEILWPLTAPLKGMAAESLDPLGEIDLDAALLRVSQGGAFAVDELNKRALNVFRARLTLVLSSAMIAGMTRRPVMRLPRGLDEGQLLNAALLRLLYQGPLSLSGLE